MHELSSHPFPLLLLLLGMLALLVWLPRRVVPARGLALLRCLLPSWRFFESLEPLPELQYRVAAPGQDWQGWQRALEAPRRTAASLLLNAEGNLHFACQSLVEHLVVELEDAAEEVQNDGEPVSYRLVCALIETRLGAHAPGLPLRYQFRLAALEPSAAPLFVSRVHGLA